MKPLFPLPIPILYSWEWCHSCLVRRLYVDTWDFLHRQFVSFTLINLFSHLLISIGTHGYLLYTLGCNSIVLYLIFCSQFSTFGHWEHFDLAPVFFWHTSSIYFSVTDFFQFYNFHLVLLIASVSLIRNYFFLVKWLLFFVEVFLL